MDKAIAEYEGTKVVVGELPIYTTTRKEDVLELCEENWEECKVWEGFDLVED